VAGTTVLVSRGLDGGTAFNAASASPLLSTNGRWVVFESTAPNLVANDTNGTSDIFIFDRFTGSNSLVSGNAEGNGSRAGASQSPAMTPDGRFVAFVNITTNASSAVPSLGHIYVRDLQTGTTMWASSNAAGQMPSYLGALRPALSAEGSAAF